jgi:hypothetical protein
VIAVLPAGSYRATGATRLAVVAADARSATERMLDICTPSEELAVDADAPRDVRSRLDAVRRVGTACLAVTPLDGRSGGVGAVRWSRTPSPLTVAAGGGARIGAWQTPGF